MKSSLLQLLLMWMVLGVEARGKFSLKKLAGGLSQVTGMLKALPIPLPPQVSAGLAVVDGVAQGQSPEQIASGAATAAVSSTMEKAMGPMAKMGGTGMAANLMGNVAGGTGIPGANIVADAANQAASHSPPGLENPVAAAALSVAANQVAQNNPTAGALLNTAAVGPPGGSLNTTGSPVLNPAVNPGTILVTTSGVVDPNTGLLVNNQLSTNTVMPISQPLQPVTQQVAGHVQNTAAVNNPTFVPQQPQQLQPLQLQPQQLQPLQPLQPQQVQSQQVQPMQQSTAFGSLAPKTFDQMQPQQIVQPLQQGLQTQLHPQLAPIQSQPHEQYVNQTMMPSQVPVQTSPPMMVPSNPLPVQPLIQ